MALFKQKYETIECSNEHIFCLSFEDTTRVLKCVVGEDEVVIYEDGVETTRLPITEKTVAPHVLQIDTVATIYGEEIPFQLENNIPFINLQGEWVSSDTFDDAKVQAKVKMYQRQSMMQVGVGCGIFAVVLAVKLFKGSIGQLWMMNIIGILFLASAGMTMVRVRNELKAMAQFEEDFAASQKAKDEHGDEDSIAQIRALHAAKEEE